MDIKFFSDMKPQKHIIPITKKVSMTSSDLFVCKQEAQSRITKITNNVYTKVSIIWLFLMYIKIPYLFIKA